MAIKLTTNTLKRLEKLVNTGGYKIRLEKGMFTSGECILERKKLIVINRFLDVEGKCRAIMELIPNMDLDTSEFEEEDLNFLQEILKENNTQDLFSQITNTKENE